MHIFSEMEDLNMMAQMRPLLGCTHNLLLVASRHYRQVCWKSPSQATVMPPKGTLGLSKISLKVSPVDSFYNMVLLHRDLIPDDKAGLLKKFSPVRAFFNVTKRPLTVLMYWVK